jgi:hypothetical protein
MRSTWLKLFEWRVWTSTLSRTRRFRVARRAAQLKISEVRTDQQHAARALRHDPHARVILDPDLRVVDTAEPRVLLVDNGPREAEEVPVHGERSASTPRSGAAAATRAR